MCLISCRYFLIADNVAGVQIISYEVSIYTVHTCIRIILTSIYMHSI